MHARHHQAEQPHRRRGANDRTARRPEKKHEGDVLGVSDAGPRADIPMRHRGGGSPKGIEVRDRATGTGDVPQRSGATGIDMGAGGEGTQVAERSSHPKSSEPAED